MRRFKVTPHHKKDKKYAEIMEDILGYIHEEQVKEIMSGLPEGLKESFRKNGVEL